jgi:hypothetical protein
VIPQSAAREDTLRPLSRDAAAAEATAAAAPQPPPPPHIPSAAESASAASAAVELAAGLLFAPYFAYARALEERPLLTKACTR